MSDAHRYLISPSKGATMTPLRPHHAKMTPLRARMIQQMQLHRLAPGTQTLYAKAIAA